MIASQVKTEPGEHHSLCRPRNRYPVLLELKRDGDSEKYNRNTRKGERKTSIFPTFSKRDERERKVKKGKRDALALLHKNFSGRF